MDNRTRLIAGIGALVVVFVALILVFSSNGSGNVQDANAAEQQSETITQSQADDVESSASQQEDVAAQQQDDDTVSVADQSSDARSADAAAEEEVTEQDQAEVAAAPENEIREPEECRAGFSITRNWPNTDFCDTSVDLSEIKSGGPGKDGIPSIDDPKFESIADASEWLVEQSPVIAVEVNGEARAYPLEILMWHEIVNDEFSDIPVAVTYCPLCNSALVFDRRVDGEVLEFGVSGNLRKSDMVMYDRQTESWWQQFTGEGIVGHYNETLLDILSSQIVGFGHFVEQFPDGVVLSRDTGFNRTYGNNPYVNYDSGDPYSQFFPDDEVDERLPATERVLAGVIGGEPIAYPASALVEERIINDTVGGIEVVAIHTPGVASALDGRNINESRDVGAMALFKREVNGRTLTFTIDEDGVVRDEETGSVWNGFGVAVEGELEGAELEQINAFPHFWFAWAAFEPDTKVYGLS